MLPLQRLFTHFKVDPQKFVTIQKSFSQEILRANYLKKKVEETHAQGVCPLPGKNPWEEGGFLAGVVSRIELIVSSMRSSYRFFYGDNPKTVVVYLFQIILSLSIFPVGLNFCSSLTSFPISTIRFTASWSVSNMVDPFFHGPPSSPSSSLNLLIISWY